MVVWLSRAGLFDGTLQRCHVAVCAVVVAIEAFATTGWTKAEPLGFLQSPFSAIGRAKGVLIAGGSLLLDLHEYVAICRVADTLFGVPAE